MLINIVLLFDLMLLQSVFGRLLQSAWTYEAWVNLAAATLAIVAGFGGAPFVVQWLKTRLKLHGEKAVMLTMFVSLLMALVTELARGAITAQSFVPVNVGGFVALVFGSATLMYHRIKATLAGDSAESDGVGAG